MPNSSGLAAVHHVLDTPDWLAPTGFYDDDLRAPLERNERKTWAPICVWATPTYPWNTMYLTVVPSSSLVPPADRRYHLRLLAVPEGVIGAPAVGTVWTLSTTSGVTITLPTYRTTDGLTGYQFAFTMTEAIRAPSDFDNDGDVDQQDFAVFNECLADPKHAPGPTCTPEDFLHSDLNRDGRVDLADFSLFTFNFTGQLASRPTYVGAAACTECHEDNHGTWTTTRHATAIDTLINEGEESNPECLPCHTAGYGEAGGFADLETTPQLANVQCENCHGPGSSHAADADHVGIEVNLDASLCGQCHQSCHGLCGDYYHPHFEQWSTSKHSTALADIRLLPEYAESCLQCHSTDYRLAPDDDKPSTTQVRYSLECVACHGPHGTTNNYQLRVEARSICAQCHTMRGASPGEEPERPQLELWHGVGGFALDGSPLEELATIPYYVIPNECARCHVYREPYGGPDQPANSGHTFEANMRGCAPCHTEAEGAARLAAMCAEVEPRLAAIARYLDPYDPLYFDPTGLSPAELAQYLIARFNYEFVKADSSCGSHNAVYARNLLDEAEAFFGMAP